MKMKMRGLRKFLNKLRKAKNKDESPLIQQELVKIHNYFNERQSSGKNRLKGYETKKSLCKLLFIYIVNTSFMHSVEEHPMDLGFLFAPIQKLLNSKKVGNVRIGYLVCLVLLNEDDLHNKCSEQELELKEYLYSCIERDLHSESTDLRALAVIALSNVNIRFSSDQIESLAKRMKTILFHSDHSMIVKRKIALCFVRLSRLYPEIISSLSIDSVENVSSIMQQFNSSFTESGDQLCLSRFFLHFLYSRKHPTEEQITLGIGATHMCIDRLFANICQRRMESKHYYNDHACPWLTINLLRNLIFLPTTTDPEYCRQLDDIFTAIKKSPTSPITRALQFECFNYMIWKESDSERTLIYFKHLCSTILVSKLHDYTPLTILLSYLTKLIPLVFQFETLNEAIQECPLIAHGLLEKARVSKDTVLAKWAEDCKNALDAKTDTKIVPVNRTGADVWYDIEIVSSTVVGLQDL